MKTYLVMLKGMQSQYIKARDLDDAINVADGIWGDKILWIKIV